MFITSGPGRGYTSDSVKGLMIDNMVQCSPFIWLWSIKLDPVISESCY